jgi:hypothetical protein
MTWDGRQPSTGGGYAATASIGSTSVGVAGAGYGAALTFTSRGPAEWLLLNITGELFQVSPNAYAVWKGLYLDGASVQTTVCHWITTGTWHDFSLTKVVNGLSAGQHTLQLTLAAEAATTLQGDWHLNVARLSA